MFKSILVTGGCGFIGTNLVPLLTARGIGVRIVDNAIPGHHLRFRESHVQVVEGDIRDPDLLSRCVLDIDAVIHLAAFGSVVDSVADPMANFRVNVEGTLNLLHASKKAGIRKFLFASTGGALIGNATPPVNELSLPKPISPYGASKLCGEAYCHAFSQSYGMQTICLRFANVYGPHSEHKKGAITAFIKALMTGQPIMIFGDGSASRDFLFVEDLCQGIVKALDRDFPEHNIVLHLASGVETSVGNLARLLRRIANKPDHPIHFMPSRRGEVDRNFASFDLARQVLGFQPCFSLEEGLQKTWEWFLQHWSSP